MKKISKFLGITLAACLLATGCTGKKAEEGNASKDYKLKDVKFPLEKTVNLKFLTQSSPLAPQNPNDKLIWQRFEKDTNVHIDWTSYTWEQFADKRNLELASGDLPDAIFDAALGDYEILKYSKDGVIVPVEDLIDKYMPNLKKIFDKYPQYRKFVTAPDGHIYSFPWIEELGAGKESIHSVDCFPWINKKWLDKLGLKMPTTTAELEKVLIAFKEQDPNGNGQKDEVPMSFIINHGGEDMSFLFGSFGLGDNWDQTVVTNDKKVVYTRTQEGYKEGVKWMNGLQNKGLIDVEAYTQDWNTYAAKGKDKRYGLYFTWDKNNVTGDNEDYVLMPPLKGPNGEVNVTRTNGFGLDRGRMVISSANKNLELTAKWIDKCYDPIQSVQNNWGTYGDDKQQNIFELKDGKLKHLPLNGASPWELRQKTFVAGPSAILDEYYGKVTTKPDDAAWRLDLMKNVMVPFMKAEYNYPKVFFSAEEIDELVKLDSAIKPYTERKRAEWITKGGVEQEWNDYLKELEKMGLNKMLEIKQKGFDAFNSASK